MDNENRFKLRHFVDVKNIRWLGIQEHAISAFKCNWRVTLDHLAFNLVFCLNL